MKNLLTILSLAVCMNANAQVCFTTTGYPVGTETTSIVSADFNNDGKLDLIAANENQAMYILYGDGLGGFGAATLIGNGDSSVVSSRCMTTGDFNTDGNVDLAVATYYELVVLYGDGAGNFPIVSNFVVGSYPLAVCSADFNGDGEIDLATANSGTISVLSGDGLGNFSSQVAFPSGNDMNAIISGDFNGDGDADLAATNNYNGGGLDSVWVYFGNGSGSFAPAVKYLAGEGPYSVCSNDFNADGYDDIAIANTNSHNVTVLLSQGASSSFYAAVNYPTQNTPFSVVSADFNLDGIPDLAFGNQGNDVSVLLGSGTGSFGAPSLFSCPGFPWEIVSADFNGDGRPDLATASHDSYNVKVLLNIYNQNCIGCGLNDSVPVPAICMVSTDSASAYNYNVVYWDNTLYSNVDSFIVYRKDAVSSTYLRIGAVSSNALSQFSDTQFSIGGPNGGNPMYSSWLYKLAIRDICGNIGEKSPYHQSMFFQQNGSNFSWNAYTVESGQTNPVTGYSFLRDDNNTGDWHVLVNTVALSTTDPAYSSYPNGNWRIDAIGFNCTPGKTYLLAHSNPIKPVVAGIEQFIFNNEEVIIYPNPASSSIVINGQWTMNNGQLKIMNTQGQLVYQCAMGNEQLTIDVSVLSKGIYFISLSDGEKTVNRKFVKE